MDVRRALINAGRFGYHMMLQQHRFMVAVSLGCLLTVAPDPVVWDRERGRR